jgi:hypothetical protein
MTGHSYTSCEYDPGCKGCSAATPMDSVMVTRHDPISPFWDRSSVRARDLCLLNTYPRRHTDPHDMCVSATLVGTTIHCHRLHMTVELVTKPTTPRAHQGKSIRWMRVHHGGLCGRSPPSGEVYGSTRMAVGMMG